MAGTWGDSWQAGVQSSCAVRGRLLGHVGKQDVSAPSPLMPLGLKPPLKASPAQPSLDPYIQPEGNLHFCSFSLLHSQWSSEGHWALLLGSFHGQILSIIQTSLKYHLLNEVFHKHPVRVAPPPPHLIILYPVALFQFLYGTSFSPEFLFF